MNNASRVIGSLNTLVIKEKPDEFEQRIYGNNTNWQRIFNPLYAHSWIKINKESRANRALQGMKTVMLEKCLPTEAKEGNYNGYDFLTPGENFK